MKPTIVLLSSASVASAIWLPSFSWLSWLPGHRKGEQSSIDPSTRTPVAEVTIDVHEGPFNPNNPWPMAPPVATVTTTALDEEAVGVVTICLDCGQFGASTSLPPPPIVTSSSSSSMETPSPTHPPLYNPDEFDDVDLSFRRRRRGVRKHGRAWIDHAASLVAASSTTTTTEDFGWSDKPEQDDDDNTLQFDMDSKDEVPEEELDSDVSQVGVDGDNDDREADLDKYLALLEKEMAVGGERRPTLITVVRSTTTTALVSETQEPVDETVGSFDDIFEMDIDGDFVAGEKD
ncbi:uncharacterized protein BROUX77_003313 [Berkeleyomyces rouxiae]|uniref:uncharacterized protein n=1 Tax=Berkeleyomyces rouxiae TaxID=2035830 RepID=UPI003B7E53B5